MSTLLLQTFVGTIYAIFIYPMFMDYWSFSRGLIANHVTQKERAARESQENYAKYLAGAHKLMITSNERKWRNLRRFCCSRKQVESQIVTVDVAPAKRRGPPPKKDAKEDEKEPMEDKPAAPKANEEIK